MMRVYMWIGLLYTRTYGYTMLKHQYINSIIYNCQSCILVGLYGFQWHSHPLKPQKMASQASQPFPLEEQFANGPWKGQAKGYYSSYSIAHWSRAVLVSIYG